MPRESLKAYCKRFVSSSGIPGLVLTLLPIFSPFLPGEVAAYVYPPLGPTFGPVGRLVAVLVCLLVIFLVYLVQVQRPKIYFSVAAVSIVAGSIAYLVCFSHFVCRVPIPARSEAHLVSVGYVRTDAARHCCGSKTDLEILHDEGFREEEIQKFWTPSSVFVARILLWLTCLCWLVGATTVAAVFVKVQGRSLHAKKPVQGAP